MRMRMHARRDPQQYVRCPRSGGVERVEAIELVEAVDDDAMNAGSDRHAQFVAGLVVAMEHEARRGHPSGQRDM